MIITDKKEIIQELHKVLSIDYPGVFHIKYAENDYRGCKCSLSHVIKVLLEPTNITDVNLWKKEVTRIVNEGVTLHYIVDISLHPNDDTDFEDIIDFVITRYDLGGGFLICNHSETIPKGMIAIVIIFGKMRESDADEYLIEEMGLDNGRECELNGPIDFEELINTLDNE